MSAHARSSVRLTVSISEGERTEHHELDAIDGRVSIGRDPRCTVPLTTGFASRQHMTVDVRGSSMKVRDTSMNGASVGGALVKQSEVHVPFGTPIAIGPVTVVLERTSKPRLAVVPSEKRMTSSVEIARVDAWAEENAVRVEVHKRLLEHLDLGAVDAARTDDPTLRPKVLVALRAIVSGLGDRIPAALDRDVLVGSLLDEAIGLGPIERFLSDPNVNEIMVVDPNTIFLEMSGKMVRADARFTNDDRVRATIERIVTPLGRRIDESVPLVDARLADGSRVNAVIKPLALRGAAITIRKFSRKPFTMDRLVELGALTGRMAQFLLRSVTAKKNIVISGGTGSGKTTLLNVLSGAIPEDERIVTIEDAAELQLRQPHVVSLETRPSNMEGKGEYTIRDLVKNALRMRPDRIVVGECRGGEALDMLQAMNTGHDGSLTTTHANSPREAVARLETLVLMAGLELPVRAIREQIAGSIQIIVQQSRLSDGTRRVTAISEVVGISDRGDVELVPIFEYVRTGTGPKGKILGDYRATGFLPTFLNDFLVMGLVGEDEGVTMSLAILGSAAAVKIAGVVTAGAAAAFLAYVLASRETALSRLWTRYVRHLDAMLRMLYRPEIGRRIARLQCVHIGAIVVAHVVTPFPRSWLWVVVIAIGPELYLRRERRKRVARLEKQVDGFVVSLASSLKTVPSPAAALQATVAILQQPTRQEIEYVLKEMRVGSTLEQGLLAMSARVKSPWLDVAFSAVLIGLRVGGNLPVVLERTAMTIREMNRLLGVVRSKTGEGRMQLWVLAAFPFLIAVGLNAVQKGYFDPLQNSIAGQIAVGIAAVLWISSLLLARKVLAVDV